MWWTNAVSVLMDSVGFKSWPGYILHYVIGQLTPYLMSQCLSVSRCINGYWLMFCCCYVDRVGRLTYNALWVRPSVMNWHPIQGGVQTGADLGVVRVARSSPLN